MLNNYHVTMNKLLAGRNDVWFRNIGDRVQLIVMAPSGDTYTIDGKDWRQALNRFSRRWNPSDLKDI